MNKTKDLSYNEWLVINSKLGDTQALNELLKDWEQRLFLYAVRKLGDQEAAKEVVQESLISIAKSPLDDIEGIQGGPDMAWELEEKLTIEQALKHLDSKLALLLKLYYQESFSILEIAEITGLPEGTVKSRLYYARKMLASFLED
jgi:RNA polymerase sigma-70 factor (ECF subfamily)